jgi:hypothetical protein
MKDPTIGKLPTNHQSTRINSKSNAMNRKVLARHKKRKSQNQNIKTIMSKTTRTKKNQAMKI